MKKIYLYKSSDGEIPFNSFIEKLDSKMKLKIQKGIMCMALHPTFMVEPHIKSVFKSKDMSGKHMTGQVPYGYLWADEKRQSWVVDDDAAAIVRQIFSLTLEGFGPHQISQLLTQQWIEIPAVHMARYGEGVNKSKTFKINAEVVMALVADMLGAIADYSKSDRAEFMRTVQETQTAQQTANVNKQKKWLVIAEKRSAELETAISGFEQSKKSASQFIALIEKYENFETMTNTMLNEFVEKILVHERDRKDRRIKTIYAAKRTANRENMRNGQNPRNARKWRKRKPHYEPRTWQRVCISLQVVCRILSHN